MTPKEKAEQLVEKFGITISISIAEEIICTTKGIYDDFIFRRDEFDISSNCMKDFWEKVLFELGEMLSYYKKEFVVYGCSFVLDGGSFKIHTNKGDFTFDKRIRTKTPGKLYLGYPLDDNSNIIKEDAEKIEKELISALKIFNSKCYREDVESFINSRQQ